MTSNLKSILVVDDEAPHRMLSKRAIKALPNTSVVEADSVNRATSVINRDLDRIALAIVDFNLGGQPGLEVVALLRSFRNFEELPVVVISTSTLDSDIEAAYAGGANCFLFKGSQPEQFAQELQSAVRYLLKFGSNAI